MGSEKLLRMINNGVIQVMTLCWGVRVNPDLSCLYYYDVNLAGGILVKYMDYEKSEGISIICLPGKVWDCISYFRSIESIGVYKSSESYINKVLDRLNIHEREVIEGPTYFLVKRSIEPLVDFGSREVL
jgi:hypothetical protein